MRSMPSVTKPVEVEAPSFEEFVSEVLRELQGALAKVVRELPGKNGRAVDLQRTLGVDKKLGWQLFTFVTAPRALSEIENVPGSPSMRRVLAVAAKLKVARATIDGASRAYERFEALVAEHGGDRSELISLANGLAPGGDPQHELRVRKSLFRGLAHVWGVQAATIVRTAVVHPSATPGSDDVLVVVGYVGLQRLRHGAPLAISASLGAMSSPAAAGAPAVTPGAAIGAVEVLPEFSSRPMPEMVSRMDAVGDLETELVFPVSGRPGAVTLYTAQRIVDAWSGPQTQHGLNTLVKLPSEMYVCELLVPSGWADPGTARASVYGRRGAVERVNDLRAIDLLPQRETVTCVAGMDGPPGLERTPGNAEAVRQSIKRLGWDDVKYDVYRSEVAYPVLHTMVRVAVDGVRG
jgi:hypothetical protein